MAGAAQQVTAASTAADIPPCVPTAAAALPSSSSLQLQCGMRLVNDSVNAMACLVTVNHDHD